MIRLKGQPVNISFFRAYMKNTFGESFAHCSLSIEELFTKVQIEQNNLNEFIKEENIEYAKKLINNNKPLYNQRIEEIKLLLERLGIPKNGFYLDEDYIPGINDFNNYFIGAIRPYRNKNEYYTAKSNNELIGKNYEKETLCEKTIELAGIIKRKITAERDARDLKKGNNEAFLYALELDDLSITDIIEINALVNTNTGINKGFKKVNNEITGSNIETCPKEFVPTRIQELLYKYNNEWALELPPYKLGDSEEIREKYYRAICEREAKFHIEFERIHPFEDGNGRTGRIILNKHLVDNELAPILITREMRHLYTSFIRNQDYKTFGQYIYLLSCTQIPQILSAYRKARGIKPDELGLTLKTTTPQD